MLFEFLLMFGYTLITYSKMLIKTKPVGFSVIWSVSNWRMIWTRIDNKISVSNEQVFLGGETLEGSFSFKEKTNWIAYNFNFLSSSSIIFCKHFIQNFDE
jgi:hypothetical protein